MRSLAAIKKLKMLRVLAAKKENQEDDVKQTDQLLKNLTKNKKKQKIKIIESDDELEKSLEKQITKPSHKLKNVEAKSSKKSKLQQIEDMQAMGSKSTGFLSMKGEFKIDSDSDSSADNYNENGMFLTNRLRIRI